MGGFVANSLTFNLKYDPMLTINLKSFFLILSVLLGLIKLNGQESKKSLDIRAITSMVGCYDVEFKYTETFAPEVDYEHAYDYTSAAFEWAELVEQTENKIVLQHLLIINDSMIIKHWRQDWIYESNDQFRYHKGNRWVFEPMSEALVQGKWTQNVYQVDDSPRYSGTATWTHVDGVSSWYNKADSPLPRREYSKRDDYNVMKRGNRIQITDYGWLHEQDNDKIIRNAEDKDVLLVQEKGYNTYKRRPDQDCKAAQDWWAENKMMWEGVRDTWADIYDRKIPLHLHVKVEDKRLYEHLFYDTKSWDKSEVKDLIAQYIILEP